MATKTDQTNQNDKVETNERPAPPDLTPYAAAKVVTTRVRKLTGDNTFELAPQTMYGLADRGTIKTVEKPGTKANGKSKIFFDGADFARWLKGYLSGTGTGEGRIRQNYEKLAEQYEIDDVETTAAAEAESDDAAIEDDESETDRQMEAEVAETE